ncbi:MAG: transglutaminase domain-containing protein [Lachnospiraceae bacterium]|nr:transglutaminase domain-containing protein [Lachnospiraceae bacterium]
MGRIELKKRDSELERRGVCKEDITLEKMPPKIISVLLRGFMIFLAAYGTVWGLVSAFGLTYGQGKVFAGILLLSMFSAVIYYNRFTFYAGYVVTFISFFVFSVMMYSYINSGFQAFINEMNSAYVDYFSLPALRVSEEIIADRNLSVPIMCIFLGWVYCIMLNVTISSYMNPVLTFVITFLPLQTAFYIDRYPSFLCMTMLIMCYASVLVLSRAGYYALPYRYKKYESFSRRRTRKGSEDSYILSAKGMLSVFGVSLILSLIFFVVSGAAFGDEYSTKYVSNKLKNKTDDYVEALVMNGITSLFNRYTATGGLARGRLGGIGSVAPDYETDLIVTYVPESTDTIYLRAFVGNIYQRDRFIEDTNVDYPATEEPFHYEEGDEFRTMTVENVDADPDYFYAPYHSASITGDPADTATIKYIPDPVLASYPTDDAALSEYTKFVFANYLYVPEDLVPVLDEVVKKAGMVVSERGSEGMLLSCYNLQSYFAENYKYSLQPGRTPLGADVVEYFLTDQDRGYCMHYASASTLLLRYVGIPARYCEGYALQASDLAQGVIVSEEDDVTTVKVEITDAAAHAWVEIFIPNYGWIPYEMTPPSFGDDEAVNAGGGLMGILSGLFTAAQRDDAQGSGGEGGAADQAFGTFEKIAKSLEFLVKPVGYSLAVVILILIAIPLIRRIIVIFRVLSYRRKGKYSEAVLVKYRSYTSNLIKKKLISSSNADSVSVGEELSGNYESEEIKSKIKEVALIVREAAFSAHEITAGEYDKAVSMMKDIKRAKRKPS